MHDSLGGTSKLSQIMIPSVRRHAFALHYHLPEHLRYNIVNPIRTKNLSRCGSYVNNNP